MCSSWHGLMRTGKLVLSLPLVPAFSIHLPESGLFPQSLYVTPSPAGSRILYSYSRVPLVPDFFIQQSESHLFPISLFNSPSAAGFRILYSTARVPLVPLHVTHPSGISHHSMPSSLLVMLYCFAHTIFTVLIFPIPSATSSIILYSTTRVPLNPAFFIHAVLLVPAFNIHILVSSGLPHPILISLYSAYSRILNSTARVKVVPAFFFYQPESLMIPHSIFNCLTSAGSSILYSSPRVELVPCLLQRQ
jgi:hypothetical protein